MRLSIRILLIIALPLSLCAGRAAAARGGRAVVYSYGSRVTLQNNRLRITFDMKTGAYSAWSLPERRLFIHNAYAQIGPTPYAPAPTSGAPALTTSTAARAATTPPRAMTSLTGCRFSYAFSEFDDRLGSGRKLRLRGKRAQGPDLLVEFSLYDRQGFFTVRAGVLNTTSHSLRLREFYPLRAECAHEGGLFLGPDPALDHRVLTGEGDAWCPRLLGEVSAQSANAILVTHLKQPVKESLVIGALTTYEFLHRVAVDYRSSATLALHGRKSFDARVRVWDPAGKRVEAGKEYLPDPTFVCFTEPNPYDALERYSRDVAQAMNVRLARYDGTIPVCMWYLASTSIGDNTSAGALREAHLMREMGLAAYAPPLVRLVAGAPAALSAQLWWDDDHWRDCGLLAAPDETLGKWVREMAKEGAACELGLQLAMPAPDYAMANPGHMLFNSEKKLPDATDPAFEKHLGEVYRRLKGEGIKGLFFDYCGAMLMGADGGFEEPGVTATAAYRRIFALARQETGGAIPITENPNGRATVGAEAATGVIDAKRSESDKVTLTPQVIRRGVREWHRNRLTKLIDPDVKNFEAFDGDLLRAQVTAMATMFGKTMLGSSVTRYTPEALRTIGRTLPMPPDAVTARPIGLFERADESDAAPNPEIYLYPLVGDAQLLMLWNHGEERAKTIAARLGGDTAFGGLGTNEKLTYDAWDYWDWEDMGSLAGGSTLAARVRPGEMKTLILHPAQPAPYVLTTTRHILPAMGAAGVEWNPKTKTLRGKFHVVGRDPFSAIIKTPATGLWTVSSYKLTGAGADSAKLACHTDLMGKYIELDIESAAGRDLGWSITFEVKRADNAEAPGPPQALAGEVIAAQGCVQLKWQEASRSDDRALRYLVYRDAKAGFKPDLTNRLGVTLKTEMSDCEIRPGETYHYKVITEDANGKRSRPAELEVSVAPTYSRAILNKIDEKTGGSWPGVYGEDGYVMFSVVSGGRDKVRLPAYIESMSYRGHKGTYPFTMSGADPRALAYSDDTTKTRRVGALAAFQDLYLELKATDAAQHALSLYFVNWEGLDRRYTIEALDQATRLPLAAPVEMSDFRNGKYIQYLFRGSIIIKITRPETSNGIVLSAVFFDEPALAAPAPFAVNRPVRQQDGRTRFSWSPTPGATLYRLKVADNPELKSPLYDDTGMETARLAPGLQPGKAYYWSVEASGGKGSAVNAGGVQTLAAAPDAVFVGIDDETLGAWRKRRGKAGCVLPAASIENWSDLTRLPDFIQSVDTQGSQYYSWMNTGRSDSPAAPDPLPGAERCGSAVYDHWFLTVDIRARDAAEHTVSLYNWLGSIPPPDGIDAWVEIVDPETGQALDRRYDRRMLDGPEGRYFTYRFKGRLKLRLRNVSGPFCFLNGIFFEN